MFYRQKIGEGQLTTHEIPLIIANGKLHRKLFDKSMKFCIFVVHDVTNEISYDAKLNRSKNCHFLGVKYKKKTVKKSRENGKISVVFAFVDILA